MFDDIIWFLKSKKFRKMLPFIIPGVIGLVLIILIILSVVKRSASSASDNVIDLTMSGDTLNVGAYPSSGSNPSSTVQIVDDQGETKEVNVYDDGVTLEYNGNTDGNYLADCIFLGDSRYVAIYNYGYMPAESVLAKVGTNHSAAMTEKADNGYTMNDFLTTHKAGVIYIGYGVNSLHSSDKSFMDSYNTLVDKVQSYCPDSKIVICSIWPVEDDGAYSATVSNELCEKFNSLLYEMAKDRGLYYLNFDEILKDDDGTMVNLFNSGDGLHYNKGAYADIFTFIVSHPVTDYVKGSYSNTDFNYDYSNPANRVYYTTYFSHPEDNPAPVSDNSTSSNTANTTSANTATETVSPSPSVAASPSPSASPSAAQSPSPSPSVAASPSPSPSPTPSPSVAESPSPSPSSSAAESPSPSPTPSEEESPSETPTPEETPEPTPASDPDTASENG